ncbi:hypothetical protein CTheo_8317 [Ceratobasidium theobromae]|uniref:Transmembrane protein n=1 Tax=Ceratobasidium theobromae TaxID=1582974 RepID=A0A5N5Q8X3_9AGAM|nr:hypothetical protein CTheo_8317 [Ceratobasidium theobromae]
MGITGFINLYVDGNHFNMTERRPSVALPDGTSAPGGHYAPLQSDIATLLSTSQMTLRWVIAGWATSLGWRGAFLLMERVGLRLQDLKGIIRYSLLPPPSYLKHPLAFLVGLTLIATILAQSASPIMTGSITWQPSTWPAKTVAEETVNISVASNSQNWVYYQEASRFRERVAIQAGGLLSYAWGRDVELGVMKRVIPSISGLNINSTIGNVTIPYFAVTSLEWISDPMTELTPLQRDVNKMYLTMGTRQGAGALVVPGTLGIIPNSEWTNTSSFPPPSVVSETGTLVLYTSKQSSEIPCLANNSIISTHLPPSIGFVKQDLWCYAFARLAYQAGVGQCTNCRLSSYGTVRNDTPLTLQADPMVSEALALAPDVTSNLVLMNISIPSSWGNIDDYVIELLARSYSGAWIALAEYLGKDSPQLTSPFAATTPALRAQVDLTRVYIWLGIHLLVTATALMLMAALSKAKYTLTENIPMVPFYLVTNEVPMDELSDSWGSLKVEPMGDRWKVRVEGSSGNMLKQVNIQEEQLLHQRKRSEGYILDLPSNGHSH